MPRSKAGRRPRPDLPFCGGRASLSPFPDGLVRPARQFHPGEPGPGRRLSPSRGGAPGDGAILFSWSVRSGSPTAGRTESHGLAPSLGWAGERGLRDLVGFSRAVDHHYNYNQLSRIAGWMSILFVIDERGYNNIIEIGEVDQLLKPFMVWAGGALASRSLRGGRGMGKLRVMSFHGDRTVVWDRQQLEVGDPEAQEAVREAERILEEQMSRGATAFRVDAGVPPRRIDRFELDADQIVTVPKVGGG